MSADDDLFSVSRKIALTKSSFLVHVLPPVACFYVMAVLVQLKGTQHLRLALLPVLVWLSWHGAFVDMSQGDPANGPMNGVIITYMLSLAMRGFTWATAQEPYQRHNNPVTLHSEGIYAALWNAWDLMFGTRGIGWSWSRGLAVPKPTLETDSRIIFVLLSLFQIAFRVLCLDACIQTARMLSPDTFGSINGGSLFDQSLPPLLELARAVFVALSALCVVYFGLQWSYPFLAIIGVVLFRQKPSQWPPLFDSPWQSTSLTELWGRRWHQLLRESVQMYGVRSFNCVFGRMGGLFGAFLVSGIIHDIELRALGQGGNTFVIVGFWLMNGLGVVLERVWKRATGRRVCGVHGRVWMFGWLALWGSVMVNEWAKVGRFGMQLVPGAPSLALVAFVRRCLGLE